MNALKEFQEIIGYKFTNCEYLKVALTHSSYANENRSKHIPFNERLEFLGDSVLGLVVSRYIFENFPKLPEGKLTKMRAAVVCERSLWECAVNIDLGNYLILGQLYETILDASRGKMFKDYKTDFQEVVQKNGDVEIKYEVQSESGPDHDKLFVVNVYLNGTLMGTGEGTSKKKAEQKAAQNALIKTRADKQK